jgi:hypothetical protein
LTELFQVDGNANLTLENIFLTGGNGWFGTIQVYGRLELINSTLTYGYGSTQLSPGGIENIGIVTITNSTLSFNESLDSAGAIYNWPGASLTIEGSRFYYNKADNFAGAIKNNGTLRIDSTEFQENGDHPCNFNQGGAIYNSGVLTVTNSIFIGNQGLSGGAIYNHETGSLSVDSNLFQENYANCTNIGNGGAINNQGIYEGTGNVFTNNHGGTHGGGFYNSYIGSASIDSDTYFNNETWWGGGGVANFGILNIRNTTIYSNTANYGGGIYGESMSNTLTITNVTLHGNVSANGASGIYLDNGETTIQFTTITGNEGAIGLEVRTDFGASVIVKNSIIANNPEGNCDGAVTSHGYNLSSDLTCSIFQTGDLRNVDPYLKPLADYGGITQTQYPEYGSPTIDAGICVSGISSDQRGVTRPKGNSCDIGAVEVDMPIKVFVPLTRR